MKRLKYSKAKTMKMNEKDAKLMNSLILTQVKEEIKGEDK